MINKDDEGNLIFKPLPWRWFFYHWALTLVSVLIGLRIVTLLFGAENFTYSFIGFFIGITIVMVLFSRYPDNWKIIITKQDIKGGWKRGKRVILSIDEIDRDRSFKKTALGKLFGFDYIYSKSGQKIYVESISLGREQVGHIKSILKL
jgi:hypothetical protein